MTETGVAMIVDIVGSRDLEDRASAQLLIREALREAEAGHRDGILRPAWPTVGDEFQALYADLAAALLISTSITLLLPAGIDCRFGLGEGDSRGVGEGGGADILDGTAWWHAREAIDRAAKLQRGGESWRRSRYYSGPEAAPAMDAVANGFLSLRDDVLGKLGERERRLGAGILRGMDQRELARIEHISQSAVSQALRRSGLAALFSGLREIAAA